MIDLAWLRLAVSALALCLSVVAMVIARRNVLMVRRHEGRLIREGKLPPDWRRR